MIRFISYRSPPVPELQGRFNGRLWDRSAVPVRITLFEREAVFCRDGLPRRPQRAARSAIVPSPGRFDPAASMRAQSGISWKTLEPVQTTNRARIDRIVREFKAATRVLALVSGPAAAAAGSRTCARTPDRDRFGPKPQVWGSRYHLSAANPAGTAHPIIGHRHRRLHPSPAAIRRCDLRTSACGPGCNSRRVAVN